MASDDGSGMGNWSEQDAVCQCKFALDFQLF